MSDLKIQTQSTDVAPAPAADETPDAAPPEAEPPSPEAEAAQPDAASPEAAPPSPAPPSPTPSPEPPAVERPVAVNDLTDEQLQAAYSTSVVAMTEGTIVSGRVVRIDAEEVLLDVGFKSEGVIPARELSIRQDANPLDIVELGEEVEALVQKKEDSEGRLILSKKRAQYEKAWGNVEKIRRENGSVSGTVIEVVKGGLIVDIGLRGFLPASLVDLRRVRDLHSFVGNTIKARVLELDKNRNNVVLSRRAWLEDEQKEQRGVFLDNLQSGEIREGVVSSVVPFGAFVDIGGMDGLVHVSELSWRHLDDPSSVLSPGEEVKVKVLDVDIERERISLSIKATQPDPWEEFVSTHRVGELVYGRITKLVPFGAFVQVGENIEGLVHISELAQHHVEVLEEVVTPGEEMWVKIIKIDVERRRMSLSVKQAAEGGVVSAEYQEHFGDHAFDEEGNYLGAVVEDTTGIDDTTELDGAETGAETPEDQTADHESSAESGSSESEIADADTGTDTGEAAPLAESAVEASAAEQQSGEGASAEQQSAAEPSDGKPEPVGSLQNKAAGEA